VCSTILPLECYRLPPWVLLLELIVTSCSHSSEEVIYEHQETSNSSRRQRQILLEVVCMITYDVQVDGENRFIAQPLWRALHSAGNVLKFSRPTYQKMLRITRSTMKHQRNCSMLPEMLCLLSRFTCACCDLLTVLNQTTTSGFHCKAPSLSYGWVIFSKLSSCVHRFY